MKILVLITQESDTVINGFIKSFSYERNIKIIEMILCKINFSFDFNPIFSLFLMLKKSSKRPVMKKPKIVSNKRYNFGEPNFIDIIERKTKKGTIIKIPPIVGVLFFL